VPSEDDPAGTRDQCAALLLVREQTLGPEHPDTLDTRSDLAYWTGEAGDSAGARDLFAALLPVIKRVLGPEHPQTVTVLVNLAYWRGWRVTRWRPGTSSLTSCLPTSGSWVLSIRIP